ncbi:sugar transferase [Peribacillus frigoritolerans]|uniref:sugar transferase n=1 Tax=Peribacillus frigoritolerans TaxID=450367 RepID=UPI0038230307
MKPYLVLKRILDFVFSMILLIIASPIMFLASIAIKLESKGPSLFKQDRPGKNAEIFTVYKFRTMRIETHREGRSLTDMERMTKIGSLLRKTSVDELPQLFNILRGEMSFIGPRPLLVNYLEHYSQEQMRRHEITPGISGWAQVNGRNTLSWEEKFKFDLWYVDNISLCLDLKILWLTLYNILNRKGINNSQGNTMPFFTGSKETQKKTNM